MLTQGENGDGFMRRLKSDLLIGLARRIVAKFSHPVTASPFAPRIYKWARELSSRYQSVYPGENNFRWSQELVSRIWSMQPLIRITPYLWLPINYFTWFPPEWFRYLTKRLLVERSRAVTRDENINEQTPLGFAQEMVNSVAYLTYPEEQREGTPFLYDVPESDMALRAEAPRRARRQRGNLIVPDQSLVRRKDLLSPSLPKNRGYPRSNLDNEDTPPVGFYFKEPYFASPEIDMAIFPFTLFRASAPEAIESTSWLEMINRLVERGRVESTTAKWQPKPRISIPVTLGTRQSIGNTVNQEMPLEAMPREAEEEGQTCLEKLLTQQQGLALSQKQGVFDISSELPIGIIFEDTKRIPELWPKNKEIGEYFPQLRTLTSMPPSLHHLLPKAEEQDMVISPLAQLGKSDFYPDQGNSAGVRLLPLGVPTTEPVNITNQIPLAEYALRQEMPLSLDWGSRYAEALSLFLIPQAAVSFGEGYPVGVVASGKEMGYGRTAHIVEPSANFGNPARPATNLALAPLARPQGNSSPTSSSQGESVGASLVEEQTEEATGADPDSLAREVYEIIKHRLLVEKEQAQGMV